MRKLPLPIQTSFADLIQRCLDATFDETFGADGRFVRRERNGRGYWYFDSPNKGEGPRLRSRYVGPADDPDIVARVERFGQIRMNALERRSIVASLRGGGLPVPIGFVGELTDALGRAGLFRLRGTLVGTVAFQTYAGLLGVVLPSAAVQTTDADFAQFHSVSLCVEDSLPPMAGILQTVDRSFRPIGHTAPGTQSTAFINATGFKVEFLTPNTGSADHMGKPALMPALGGVSAEPLRYLDFLIYNALRSVLVHGSGVLVNVPAPERYAVHKLIVTTLRRSDRNGVAKARKDVQQAGLLLEAMEAEHRLADVGAVWVEAWQRGPKWRTRLAAGSSGLAPGQRSLLQEAIRMGCKEGGYDPADFGSPAAATAPAAQQPTLKPRVRLKRKPAAAARSGPT